MNKNLKEQFKNPDPNYRGAPFWAWNTKLEKETVLRQIKTFKEMGFGGFHIHPRVGLKTPYLGEEFMNLVEASMEKGKALNLYTCLYDEDRWPSGFAGGKVTNNTQHRMRHLLFTQVPFDGNIVEKDENKMANFAVGVRSGNGELLACYDVILNESGYLLMYSKIDENQQANGLKWYAYSETNPIHPWYNNETYVDVLNKKAIDSFIESNYEVYKKRLGKEFGQSVPSIFTDEPHMLFKTNHSKGFSREDLLIPWTDNLLEIYKKAYHMELLDILPELFWESQNKEYSKGRYYYHQLISDLFEEAYPKNIGNWCRENHIAFTGHYLYEETLFEQNRSGGDLLRMYRHMDIPGMDLLFNEVDLITGKQIQSIVHQYGKKGAMSELYGVTNWSFDFRGYKFQGDWQAALGITLRVPHLALMTMAGEAKRDFPASIFYQAPWYREFKQIEDHFARINLIMEQGKPCERAAVIHPIESYWVAFGPEDQTGDKRADMDEDFQNLIKWLLPGGINFDYLSEGLLPELCREVSYPLKAGKMRYEIVIIPNCLELRDTTIEILEKFAAAGGKVIAAGEYPTVYSGVKNQEALERLKKFSKKIPYSRHSILEALNDYRDVKIENSDRTINTDYIYQLKKIEQDKVLFMAPIKEPVSKDIVVKKDLHISIKGEYIPVCYDTLSGAVYELPASHLNGNTEIYRELYSYDSLLIWFKKGKTIKNIPDENKKMQWQACFLKTPVAYMREEPNVLLLDMAGFALDNGEFEEIEEILRIDTIIRNRLNMPLRSFSMAQPYTRVHQTSSHKIKLRYTVVSEISIDGLRLALEERENTQISWNGERVSNDKTGWYVDEKIEKIKLGKLKNGINILELELPFGEDTDLEPVYLLGDFGVEVIGKYCRITKEPELIHFGSLVGQKFDFYSGNINYSFKVNCINGRLKIRTSKYRGALIGVFIDEKRRGSIIYPPYIIEIKDLEPGEHMVTLCLFGNRYNTFSHLHTADDSVNNISMPYLWRTVNDGWSYEYNLSSFGILKEPEVFV